MPTQRLFVFITLLLCFGCSDSMLVDTTNTCAAADAHVTACTGTSGLVEATCDVEQANLLLETQCEALSPAVMAKADFWSTGNPLCVLMAGAGDLPDGTLCCFDFNCSAESVCQDYRCIPIGGSGDDCDRNSHCAATFVCGPDGNCQAPIIEAEACNRDDQCVDGLRCVAGACAPPRLHGEACETGAGDCADELFCSDGQCQTLVEADGACELNAHCQPGLVCAVDTCAEPGELGAACDIGDADCHISLYCIANTCQSTPALGDPCERDPIWMCGYKKICWEGVCDAVHTEGQTCLNSMDCDVAVCDDGVCEKSPLPR
ncbi:MAG TPA: hypothetical protein EYN66_04080 [Myxococcales bacterium]|nr:hypothetical protein [Myxococcales bacterium]